MDIPGFDSLAIFLITFICLREAGARLRVIRLAQRATARTVAKG